jgi:hypothetical protein
MRFCARCSCNSRSSFFTNATRSEGTLKVPLIRESKLEIVMWAPSPVLPSSLAAACQGCRHLANSQTIIRLRQGYVSTKWLFKAG